MLTPTNKRIWLSLSFVVVIILLFSFSTRSTIKNQAGQESGLVYSNKTLSDVVNIDSDLDGVLDWEEGLWGTDPFKKDTNGNGIEDSIEIANLKREESGTINLNTQNPVGPLTKTENFSRELFSTLATLNQVKELDQDTLDQFNASLIQQIENSGTETKVSFSEIKTTGDNSLKAITDYRNNLVNISKKYPTIFKNNLSPAYSINIIFVNVFQKFLTNENNEKALLSFDPVIKELRGMVSDMKKISVPTNFSVLHLNLTNAFQAVAGDLNDLKSITNDPIVAMRAASSYREDITFLEETYNKLEISLEQRFNN